MKNGWKIRNIGDLVDPVDNWNPARAESSRLFNYIDLSAVDQANKLIVEAREMRCGDAPSRARQLVLRDDVLVSTVRPNLNGVAKVPSELSGATASTGFCVLRPKASFLHPGYLFQWVKTRAFVADMVRKAIGASYPAVSDKVILESKLPLPPLPEQRRIAEVLDRAEALRANRRAALAELDGLKEAMFLEMFGDPIKNPMNWPSPTLGAKLSFHQYGPRFHNEVYASDGIRIVRITDLSESGELDFVAMPRIGVTEHERQKYQLQPGDLIFARSGATVGKVAVIEQDAPPCIAGAYFIVMRFACDVEPAYAGALMTSRSIRSMVTRRSRQAAQQNFSGPGLRQLPFPLPPLELQREFATRVEAIERLKAAQRASFAELDALFASLQHRAFRGEL